MQYIITFLEGIITFISPCLLPMLPIYISYFSNGKEDKRRTFINAAGFVAGFTCVFVALGAFAGTIGRILSVYRVWVDMISGGFVILLGLNFIGIIRIGFLNKTKRLHYEMGNGLLASFLFGIVFSIGWTPCVGAFLGSALLLASRESSFVSGTLLLITYSLGLGIPFMISALLIDRLKGTLTFIKRNYQRINMISGIFLIVVGLFMASGMLGNLLRFLSI